MDSAEHPDPCRKVSILRTKARVDRKQIGSNWPFSRFTRGEQQPPLATWFLVGTARCCYYTYIACIVHEQKRCCARLRLFGGIAQLRAQPRCKQPSHILSHVDVRHHSGRVGDRRYTKPILRCPDIVVSVLEVPRYSLLQLSLLMGVSPPESCS